jgi:hypothetical protein
VGALLGGGLAPSAILLYDLRASDIQPATTAQFYQALALLFGGMAAVGCVWGLIATVLSLRAPVRAG